MSARRHTALGVTPAHTALPSPVRAAAPYGVILAATAIAAAAGLISGRPAAALASAGTAAAALAALWAWFRRARMRELADRFIATGSGAQPPVEAVIARRAELTSSRERRGLARSMSEAVAVAEAPPVMTARVPIDRHAVVAESALLRQLAHRLDDLDAPVAARGVALAELLVTDCASPLYRGAAPGGDELHRRLTQILFEIER